MSREVALVIAEMNVTTMLNENNDDPFVVAEKIDKQYRRGLITKQEAFDMLDALTKYF